MHVDLPLDPPLYIIVFLKIPTFLLQDKDSIGIFEGLMAGSDLTMQEYQELQSILSQSCM